MPALWQDLMPRHDYMIIFVPYRGRVAYHDDAAALYIGFVKGGHMNDKKRQCPAKVLLQLFVSFLRIGLFTFGGGYAMIPLIQKETVENKHWISDEDILEIIAIAESTPGPIAINSATFVGWRVGGFFGALLATLGVVIPSFAVITVISFFLNEFKHIRAVAYAFFGIRAGVLALILKALFSMFRQSPRGKGAAAYIICAAAFIAVAVFEINAVFVIAGCALSGLVYTFVLTRRDGR